MENDNSLRDLLAGQGRIAAARLDGASSDIRKDRISDKPVWYSFNLWACFFGNRFYVASTDTRRVGLNFQLCVPYTRDFRLLIRFCELEFGGSAGSMTERQMASKTRSDHLFSAGSRRNGEGDLAYTA
ncbi:hypothetical protein LWV33_18735 [Brucella intermedia]